VAVLTGRHVWLRWWQAVWTVLLVLALFATGWLALRSWGESARTKAAAERAATMVVARLERENRADCAFKRDIILLPAQTPMPGPVLVQLAVDARVAYLGKGCALATDPATGRPFGPPPDIPKPR